MRITLQIKEITVSYGTAECSNAAFVASPDRSWSSSHAAQC
ncbi:hypothetical protein H650_19110 [Enterobacter sp. R4-368]|nr:hypothetical protein H650_19110 [Enterobacter sp. R4-368]